MNKKNIIENLIKNLIVIIIAVLFIKPSINFLSTLTPANLDSVLFFVNFMLVAALFGNFAFTYEFSSLDKTFDRYLGHLTSGLLMLSIAILLIISIITLNIKLDSTWFGFTFIAVIIYIASVGYDFWDLLRYKK